MANSVIKSKQIALKEDFGWASMKDFLTLESGVSHIGALADNTSIQIRFKLTDTSSIRIYFASDHGYLQRFESGNWVTLKTIY